jgi:hypothetical protein
MDIGEPRKSIIAEPIELPIEDVPVTPPIEPLKEEPVAAQRIYRRTDTRN